MAILGREEGGKLLRQEGNQRPLLVARVGEREEFVGRCASLLDGGGLQIGRLGIDFALAVFVVGVPVGHELSRELLLDRAHIEGSDGGCLVIVVAGVESLKELLVLAFNGLEGGGVAGVHGAHDGGFDAVHVAVGGRGEAGCAPEGAEGRGGDGAKGALKGGKGASMGVVTGVNGPRWLVDEGVQFLKGDAVHVLDALGGVTDGFRLSLHGLDDFVAQDGGERVGRNPFLEGECHAELESLLELARFVGGGEEHGLDGEKEVRLIVVIVAGVVAGVFGVGLTVDGVEEGEERLQRFGVGGVDDGEGD